MFKEGPCRAAAFKARPNQLWGMGNPAQAVVGAHGGLAGGNSPQGPGTPG